MPIASHARDPLAHGVRPADPGIEVTLRQQDRLEWLEVELEGLYSRGAREYRYHEAIGELRALRPYFGFPAHIQTIRLLARLHQYVAWFAMNSGFAASAHAEARHALALFGAAHRQEGAPQDLQRLAEAGLIAAQARYLASQPRQTLAWLDVVRRASEDLGGVGFDYYRQRGVALFQLSADQQLDHESASAFRQAVNVMDRDGEAEHPLALRMAGERHLHFLSGNFGASLELHGDARAFFGHESLEASMTAHWAVACGLSTDSVTAHTTALTLLDSNKPVAKRFGHQATVSRLLGVTRALGLNSTLRSAWVRRALYGNAFLEQ